MKRIILLIALVLGAIVPGLAVDDPCLPAKPSDESRLVFQNYRWLADHEEQQLNAKLVRFAQETSNRILVLIVDSLCGHPASDYAALIGEKWGVGGKEFNNGVVLLVKPTGSPGERKVFIATGYGLEGAIPDATCRRIVDNEIIPRFRNGESFAGLDAGTDVLMKLARGEISKESYGKAPFPAGAVVFIVGLLLFMAIVIFATISKARRYARTNNIDMWSAWWLLNQAQRSHRGHWGGFTGGGGGGWSGGGGGGFGGFGGGSFGGGGAGGSW